jgi:hypothetical protein
MGKIEFPGRIKVRMVLDPAFGEVSFEIEDSVIKNKCLYDALSGYGIEIERAKYIVADMAKSVNTAKYYHMDETDYVKYGRERRQEIERGDQAGSRPVKLRS